LRGRKDTFAPADCGGERPRRPRGSDAFESESTRTARLLGVLISTDLTFDVSQRPVLLPAAGDRGALSVSRQNPLQHLSVPLSPAAWTTAAVCSSGHRVQSQTSFSASSVQMSVL